MGPAASPAWNLGSVDSKLSQTSSTRRSRNRRSASFRCSSPEREEKLAPSKDKDHALDVFSMTAWQLVIGALPLIAVAWVVPSPPIHWTWQFLACLFFSGFVATALGWVIWMYVLDVLPAGTASLSTLAIPVITVFGAALQLGEVPALHEIQGMLLVATALALLSYLGVRQHRRDDPVLGQE